MTRERERERNRRCFFLSFLSTRYKIQKRRRVEENVSTIERTKLFVKNETKIKLLKRAYPFQLFSGSRTPLKSSSLLFPRGAFHQSVTLGDNGTTIECVETGCGRRREEPLERKKERISRYGKYNIFPLFLFSIKRNPIILDRLKTWRKRRRVRIVFSRRGVVLPKDGGGDGGPARDIQRMYRFMNRYSQ